MWDHSSWLKSFPFTFTGEALQEFWLALKGLQLFSTRLQDVSSSTTSSNHCYFEAIVNRAQHPSFRKALLACVTLRCSLWQVRLILQLFNFRPKGGKWHCQDTREYRSCNTKECVATEVIQSWMLPPIPGFPFYLEWLLFSHANPQFQNAAWDWLSDNIMEKL